MSVKSVKPAASTSGIDRREFLGAVGAAAGALVAVSVAHPCMASTGRARHLAVPTGPAAARVPVESEEPWHVDDMWGHRPRYAHPIPHSPARTSPVLWDRVDPIDYMLVV